MNYCMHFTSESADLDALDTFKKLNELADAPFSVYLNFFQKPLRGKLTVESMEDGKGIYVGEVRPQYKQSDPSKWSPETRKRVEEYERDIKAQDESHKFQRLGHEYYNAGNFEKTIRVDGIFRAPFAG